MGLCYDLTSIFSLWDPPLPPVECDGIRMEAYQPSMSGPVFHARGDTMVKVKAFRFYRTKYNLYQHASLYGSPLPCIVIPVFIFQKYDDWTWWIGLFAMLNLWVWVGGIMISTFVTAWVLGCMHGVRQRPLLTMRQRAVGLFQVLFSLDWDIKGPDGISLSASLEPSALQLEGIEIVCDAIDDEVPAAEDTDEARVQYLEAGLAQAQERASIAEERASSAEARANIAEARVAELEANLNKLAWRQPSTATPSLAAKFAL